MSGRGGHWEILWHSWSKEADEPGSWRDCWWEGFKTHSILLEMWGEDMKVEYRVTGTPQGGVISPLLANIYLHPYDERMTQEGYKAVRFADDIIILCRSRTEAEKALRRTREILEGELSLKLNSQKTKITHKTQTFEFLCFLFGCGYSDYKIPRERAVKAYKDRVRHLTRRHQPKSMSQIIGELNPVVRGWGNYFLKGNCQRIFDQLDFWLRNRVTAFKLKRQGGYGHRKYPYSKLRAMGMLFLKDLLYAKRPELLPARGQRLRRAGCCKSARPVRWGVGGVTHSPTLHYPV